LGEGRVAEVFAFGDTVVKRMRLPEGKHAIFREAFVLAQVERLELPAPRVISVGEFDGGWGLQMSRIDGPVLAEQMLAGSALEVMAACHRLILSKPGAGLPALKQRVLAQLEQANISDSERADCLSRLASLPDGQALCHGDFHPYNIICSTEGPVVIDWPDATCGNPAADICRSYLLLHHHDPALAMAYVAQGAPLCGVSTAQVFAWLRVLAAARLSEGAAGDDARLRALMVSPPEANQP